MPQEPKPLHALLRRARAPRATVKHATRREPTQHHAHVKIVLHHQLHDDAVFLARPLQIFPIRRRLHRAFIRHLEPVPLLDSHALRIRRRRVVHAAFLLLMLSSISRQRKQRRWRLLTSLRVNFGALPLHRDGRRFLALLARRAVRKPRHPRVRVLEERVFFKTEYQPCRCSSPTDALVRRVDHFFRATVLQRQVNNTVVEFIVYRGDRLRF
mmetsp:Transcript_5714/g.12028  ORF Transcript_5714/g.12028 Transcript_5714/m.12028 type:complete len:212 (+) Transcript_5714:289-924(+)